MMDSSLGKRLHSIIKPDLYIILGGGIYTCNPEMQYIVFTIWHIQPLGCLLFSYNTTIQLSTIESSSLCCKVLLRSNGFAGGR